MSQSEFQKQLLTMLEKANAGWAAEGSALLGDGPAGLVGQMAKFAKVAKKVAKATEKASQAVATMNQAGISINKADLKKLGKELLQMDLAQLEKDLAIEVDALSKPSAKSKAAKLKAPALKQGMVLEVVSEDYLWHLLTPGDRGYVTKIPNARKGNKPVFLVKWESFLPVGPFEGCHPMQITRSVVSAGKVRIIEEPWSDEYGKRRREWFKHVAQELGQITGDKDDLDCRCLDFVGMFPGIRAQDLVGHGFGHCQAGSKVSAWHALKRLVKKSKVYPMPPPNQSVLKLLGEEGAPLASCRLYRT